MKLVSESIKIAFESVFLTNELRVTSYELLFIARVTSYFLHTSYELLLIARVTS